MNSLAKSNPLTLSGDNLDENAVCELIRTAQSQLEKELYGSLSTVTLPSESAASVQSHAAAKIGVHKRSAVRKSSRCFKNNIRQCQIALGPIEIDEPGVYTVIEDLTAFPEVPNTKFPLMGSINVSASNVTIDLNGFTFRQGNETSTSVGIVICPNVDNVKVINGTIADFTGVAIHASVNVVAGSNETLDALNFSNLLLRNNGGSESVNAGALGIIDFDFSQESSKAIRNVRIERCRIVFNRGLRSVALVGVGCVQVVDCNVDDHRRITSTDSSSSGIACDISYSNDIFLRNTTFNRVLVSHASTDGGQLIGLLTSYSNNILAQNCQSNGNRFEGATPSSRLSLANGSNLSNCRNSIFENCQFNDVDGGNQSSVVNGVSIVDLGNQSFDTNGVVFRHCQFNDSRNAFGNVGSASGINMITSKNVLFDNCSFNRNGSLQGFGAFVGSLGEDPLELFADVDNITFRNCEASGNSATVGPATGFYVFSAGFERTQIAGQTANVVLDDCVACKNQSQSHLAAGIRLERARDAGLTGPLGFVRQPVVKNCVALDNIGGNAAASAGILLFGADDAELYNNTSNKNQNGILLTGTLVNGGSFAARALVQGNRVSNNSVAGIVDERQPSNSAFVDNTAFNNNGQNYVIDGGSFAGNGNRDLSA